MTREKMSELPPRSDTPTLRLMNHPRRVLDTGLAILVWLAVIGVVLWSLAHVAAPVVMFTLGAILAYALTPLVGRLSRIMPRMLAVLIVYLGLLVVMAGVIFLLVATVIQEVGPLVERVSAWLQAPGVDGPAAITGYLQQLGISQDQINSLTADLATFLKGFAGDAVPVASGLLGMVFNAVIVGIVSIYLVLDGGRFLHWASGNTPLSHRRNASFFVQSLDRVMGGYIRGQLLLCLAIAILIGFGMWVIGVPFPLVLAVLAFVLEFIPMIGLWLVGALCVLVALSQGWQMALLALAVAVVASVIEGNILSPRLLGHAVGVHPLVSLFALLAFAEIFGLWGALFAAPAVGSAQALATAFWRQWRSNHPEQYPEDAEDVDAQPVGAGILAPANDTSQLLAPSLAQEVSAPAGAPPATST
jgi:predicted PurR-regulated permease PerM